VVITFTVLLVLTSLLLILLVLLHKGRGGGLSDMFGGAGTTALGSTSAERNLTRITTVFALLWFFSVLALGFLLVRY
jgi:preprotein translocase subunit SecG